MNHADTTTAARRRPTRACALAASTVALLVPQTLTGSPATAATPAAAQGPRGVAAVTHNLGDQAYRLPGTGEPVEVAGVHEVTCAGECDPFGAYGGDGGRHWTPELVLDWWSERRRVREWAAKVAWGERAASEREHFRDAAAGARAYLAHLDHGLEKYLRDYMFWLSEGRPAAPGERLPTLDA